MVMPAPARDFQVVAVDQRGIGLTDKPKDGYDTGTLAGDLVALMEVLGHQRFAVVGHDTGLIISYALAADHPDRVDRLVLVEDPGPPGVAPAPPLFVPEPISNRLRHIPFNRVNGIKARRRRRAERGHPRRRPLGRRGGPRGAAGGADRVPGPVPGWCSRVSLALAEGEPDGYRSMCPGGAVTLPVEGRMPSLDSATGWLNSPPLTAAGLRGHVVLINFWTYTCINWLRSLAYVRAWAGSYKDRGLLVIGVHTPEFDFEHDLDNVRRAVTDLQVDYPVAVDSDYGIWNAFGNRYWPAFYFVDAQGQIRHHRFGEGDYEQSEMVLQQLLTDAGTGGTDQDLVSVDATGVEAAADWDSLWSPENYLGYQRTENFASSNGAVLDTPHAYAVPERLRLNHWALSGDWTVQRQAVVLHQADGEIAYRFHARDLHLVMAPAAPGTPVRFRIRLDGQPPGAAHGTDVDDQGNGSVTEPRLYQLIRQPGPVTERTFEATFLDPGVHAYAFTFGWSGIGRPGGQEVLP